MRRGVNDDEIVVGTFKGATQRANGVRNGSEQLVSGVK